MCSFFQRVNHQKGHHGREHGHFTPNPRTPPGVNGRFLDTLLNRSGHANNNNNINNNSKVIWRPHLNRPLNRFDSLLASFLLKGGGRQQTVKYFESLGGTKSLIGLEGKSMTLRWGNTIFFRSPTPSSPSQTLERLFELKRRPARPLDSWCIAPRTTENLRHSQVCRNWRSWIWARTTDLNLDCALVKNALFYSMMRK